MGITFNGNVTINGNVEMYENGSMKITTYNLHSALRECVFFELIHP